MNFAIKSAVEMTVSAMSFTRSAASFKPFADNCRMLFFRSAEGYAAVATAAFNVVSIAAFSSACSSFSLLSSAVRAATICSSCVLVQPEVESGRSLLASIAISRAQFGRHRPSVVAGQASLLNLRLVSKRNQA